MAQDTHAPPADAEDPAHVDARARHIEQLRDLLARLESGERPSFALVHQHAGEAPRFCYSVTGDGYPGHVAASGALLLVLDEVRAAVVAQANVSRLAWREEEILR